MIHTTDNLAFKGIGLDLPLDSLSNGRTYRKQVAYVGTFGHYDQRTGAVKQSVKIEAEDIDHWCLSVKAQVADGVGIPIQDTHEDTPDPNVCYGSILDAETGADSKGRYSLFFICEFADGTEAARLSKVSDVSIYQPPSAVSGTGKMYARPIRHLMLTTKPVVPGLDKFLALSLIPERPKMIKPLATKLGIAFAVDATDEDVCLLVEAEVGKLRTAAKPVAQSAPKASAGMVKLVGKTREAQLENLVTSQRITPAVRTELSKAFADGAAIALSADGGDVEDPIFDGVIVALSALPSMGIVGKIVPNIGTPATVTEDDDKIVNLMKQRKAAANAKK